jgi:hypothetical protein
MVMVMDGGGDGDGWAAGDSVPEALAKGCTFQINLDFFVRSSCNSLHFPQNTPYSISVSIFLVKTL